MKHPDIQSNRLKLQLISLADLELIHQLHSYPEVDEFNTLGIPENIEETRSIVNGWLMEHHWKPIRSYTFKILLQEDQSFIGLISLKIWPEKHKKGEVWYKLAPQFWCNGFATEALSVLLDFAFDQLGLHRVQAGCAVNNIASIKVLEKVGMKMEGRGRQVLPLKSGWSDNFEFAILDSDRINSN